MTMLSFTFQHLKGINAKKEAELWRTGITSWDDLEHRFYSQVPLFSDIPDDLEKSLLHHSKRALSQEDVGFFAKHLDSHEYYRIALSFPEKTMFLDIETTGLSKYYDTITLVGWSMGKEYGAFIKGNQDKPFRKALSKAKIVITFNGTIFDLPFIRKEIEEVAIPACHIDLRFLSKRVGLSGGQKKIENILGIERPEELSNIKGETAPLLWYQYCWGDKSALKRLILYNHADIEGMKIIFDEVVERLAKRNLFPLRNNSIYRFANSRSDIRWTTGRSHNGKGISIQPYKGQHGPLVFLKNLNVLSKKSDFRIVGIDLTGSEARPSGWCFLRNDVAETKLLGTDAEIINETLLCRPHLVSIDSPLSIPWGRKSVRDDDPGRDKYGIMRYCERLLKKRGVNVYPALIPSMQKLTERGIRLAQSFRSFGIPVIESYPGAAQDIMGIPRKRASLEFLARGLELFGIDGEFAETPVSHDELDAITSAVVGLFFWSGKYEALGNTEEEYLIIPDLKADTTAWRKRKVIGLSGPIAAGKTTAGKFLEKQGYFYIRFSQILEKELHDRDIKPNRQTLQQIGQEVNEEHGQRWLCRKLVQMLPKQGNVVIDGLRHPEDHAFMVETFGPAFFLIYIDAIEDVRLKRYIADNRSKREFFKAKDHPVESNVSLLFSLANVVIENMKTKKGLETDIFKGANIKKKRKGVAIACL